MRSIKYLISILLLLTVTLGLSLYNELAFSWIDTDESTAISLNLNEVASPSDYGLDETVLAEMVEQAANGYWGNIDSIHIVRNGQLVLAEYLRNYNGTRPHAMFSATKSVTSMLIGIAIEQGFIESVDQKMMEFFPDYDLSTVRNPDDRKAGITLEHLLMMKSGIQWDEWSTRYGTPSNPTYKMVASRDWIQFMLDQPMDSEPGTKWTYNSGVTVLLSGIILNATGLNVRDFAQEYLFGPLGIEGSIWEAAPNNIFNTGWGLHLKPEDMLKLGFLSINDGMWEGEKIVSNDWLDQSTQLHQVRSANYGYGYQWSMFAMNTLEGHTPSQDDVPVATGYGSQKIYLLDQFDMVVTMTGENYQGAPRLIDTIIHEYIVPAITNVDLESAN